MEKYQIFISYRRDGGDMLAGRLTDKLRELGYSVFFDIESMRSGMFNAQILDAISMCDDVIAVLPPNALDRCFDENDWVRKELSFSIANSKNIIPVLMRGFVFPEILPNDIDKIRFMQGVKASSEYFDAVVQKIESLLISPKKNCIIKSDNIDSPNEKLKKILNKLYEIVISYRNSLRNADVSKINITSNQMMNTMQEVYIFSERYKYSQKEISDLAMEMVMQFNDYGELFNKFVNSPDRTTAEAQEYARLAEIKFNKLIDMIIKSL